MPRLQPPAQTGFAKPPPDQSFTGGQDFLPNNASTAGNANRQPMSDNLSSQDDSQVTPEEQKQYDDFVTRAKLFINDPRVPLSSKGQPQQDAKAPRDMILDHLNVRNDSASDALGRTTAQVCWVLYTAAKRAGMPYTPDVLYHGADEVMSDLYQIGVASGVIKNPPPDGSQEEEHFLGIAKLNATKYFGQNLIDTGQANSKQAQEYYLAQIKKEGDSGALDQWDPSQQFTPQQMAMFMHKAATGTAQVQGRPPPPTTIQDFAGRGHPQLVPPGGAPAPAPEDQSQGGTDAGATSQGSTDAGSTDMGAPQ